jgi:hypothetical protein
VFTNGGTVDDPANGLAHLSAAADESTVLTIEPIPEVVFVEGGVIAPLWYLIKDAVGAFDTEFGIAGTTDLRSFDRTGDGDTPAMATADESTSIHAVEPVLVVFRLFLVVGAAPSREI